MLLLFSFFLIVAGKVGVDFIISDIFKTCVLELGFIGEGVAAMAVILGLCIMCVTFIQIRIMVKNNHD